MKAIAFSIVVLSGSLMAAAGTIAESLPSTKRYSVVDEWGIVIALLGIVMLIAEHRLSMRTPSFNENPADKVC